ncbi:hypothetical protein LUZ60_009863 [Juncus effusus]|nr:hypothetical protein LUZ60_009863 [Juncus effusus]
MACRQIGVFWFLFVLLLLLLVVCGVAGQDETEEFEGKEIVLPEVKNLGPWAKGLLKNIPNTTSDPSAIAPDAKFPLILAEERTKRPDLLNKFRVYEGGWNITNKHYWASVGFTGAAGFILAGAWFLSFGLALSLHFCCNWRGKSKSKEPSSSTRRFSLALLLLFTCAASTGCILLTIGQNQFRDKALGTLNFVANQSDFTAQTLENVTDFLSFAETINVGPVYLPSDVQQQIEKVKGELTDAASLISEKTKENYKKIRLVINDVRLMLIVVSALMLLLAVLGFLFSVFGHKHAIYIFVVSGWLLVAITFLLLGIFLIINSAATDTCTSMDEWVQYPQAETALSNILPCVAERTANQTLYQSKKVVVSLVKIVNRVIRSQSQPGQSQGQSGIHHKYRPVLPYLCSPYDVELNDRECTSTEVSLVNASLVWENSYNYNSSINVITYGQLVMAANVSYALYHYTPLLLNLQDCKFVRDTFSTITAEYCPLLERNLRLVCVGLAMISVGVLLCLVLWVLHANRPQRRVDVFVLP